MRLYPLANEFCLRLQLTVRSQDKIGIIGPKWRWQIHSLAKLHQLLSGKEISLGFMPQDYQETAIRSIPSRISQAKLDTRRKYRKSNLT